MLNTVNLFVALVVAAITYGTPLLFGTLGEVLTEKSGSLNLGVEGIMFMGGAIGLGGVFYYEKAVESPSAFLAVLIGLLCGFAALVVIAAVLIGLFAAHGGSHGTTGNTEVDQLIERYFTYFENDDISGMNKIFLPEAVAFMRDDDDGLLTVEEAIEELDDWYDDYGRTIDDYDIYDSDQLDEEDLTQLEWALDVRIDDNLVVACDVTYAGGADEDFYFEFVQVSGQWYLLFAMD